ncbi:hypothetical protein [Cognatilysobacter lacus]|uniref:Uncharacterized protein n=1 Tax=Cognatilysobacter lacus TaxID=1643323 RepID=A0A5D8Z5P7_9GAMM|nr:hypothetical protein [Lysobacter lacus]TZF90069.1 hypothetical protein FW784_06755 [Lysobacter lacus]
MRPARQHAHQHAQSRLRERRERLASEAARLMAESGIANYHQAKLKAAERLGISDDASLPRNTEIETALRQYQRLFGRETAGELHRRREAALEALRFFRAFEPRLVGPVLEGTAHTHSPVMLHLHADDADAVHRFFVEHDIPAQPRSRRLRLDRHREADVPVWTFSADNVPFDVTVLPHDVLRQAPLSPVDEKPMRRASQAQLRQIVAEAEIDGFERGLG